MPLLSLSYSEAVANAQEAIAYWPRKPEEQMQRLKPFCLPELRPSFKIAPEDLVFTIGSCFARNVEKHLIIEGFNVAVTRFDDLCDAEGVKIKSSTLNKFVAQSILNELKWALVPGEKFPEDSIVEVGQGRFLDMQLAAGLMPTRLETMLGMRRAVSNYMKMVRDAKVIIITLGLAEAWYDKKYNVYLNTTPLKGAMERYPDRFEFHVLEYNELVSTLREIIALLDKYGHPDYRMLLTVSPVALGTTFTGRDAFTANCYSKSVQRAAAEVISYEYDRVDYLPSYESVTLSERAVAWRDDGAHVSDDAVRINVLRMQKAYATVPVTAEQDVRSTETARAAALSLTKEAMQKATKDEAASADELFRQAAVMAPDEVLVRIRWGQFLFKQRRFQEAAIQLAISIDRGGREYGVAYLLARALVSVGDHAGAERALRMALEDDPDKPGAIALMAKTLTRLGRVGDATPFYRRTFKLQVTKALHRLLPRLAKS